MAASVLLSDWNTVRGSATTTTVTQQEQTYADLLHFQDVVAFIEVADISGTPTIVFQTSPTKDDAMFQDMLSGFTPGVTVTTKILRYSSATVPLARYMRWKITGAAAASWSITFRVWLSPNMS